jgi:hypothetical protein
MERIVEIMLMLVAFVTFYIVIACLFAVVFSLISMLYGQ